MQTALAPTSVRQGAAGRAVAALALILAPAVLASALVTPAASQSLRLSLVGAPPEAGPIQVGQTVTVQLRADFQATPAAGVAAYLTIPDDVFEVRDLGLPGRQGVQPFRLGELFAGAQVATNQLLPESDPVAAAVPGRQLDLAVVFGRGARDRPVGEGVVASFELVALTAADDVRLHLDDTPVRESKWVGADGRTERRFVTVDGLALRLAEPPSSLITDSGWARLKGTAWPAAKGF